MMPQAELDRELRMMHALEHACNGRDRPCHLGNEEHVVCSSFMVVSTVTI